MGTDEVQSRSRRATYVGNRTLLVGDAAAVLPGPDEVRIDVAYTGICGTDLHILHGAMDGRVSVPAVIGHEMSGRIAELGPGVSGWTGPVGLLVALAARAVGADVIVLELDGHRRAIGTSIGLSMLDPGADITAAVDEWTAGAGVDGAFEVSGSAGGITTATHALAVRGRLVMVAIHSAPREVDLFRVFWRELTVLAARVYERQDFETAVRLVHAGDIPAEALISEVVSIDGVAGAFAVLEAGGAMKILVDCQSG